MNDLLMLILDATANDIRVEFSGKTPAGSLWVRLIHENMIWVRIIGKRDLALADPKSTLVCSTLEELVTEAKRVIHAQKAGQDRGQAGLRPG